MIAGAFADMIPQVFGVSFEAQLPVLLIAPAALAFWLLNRGVKGKAAKAVLALRIACIALLMLVLAMPYTVREQEIRQESTAILAIDDRTDSMSVTEPAGVSGIAGEISDRTGGLARASVSNITTSNRTALGDAIYRGILDSPTRNSVIILSSDGRSNYGADVLDVAAFAVKARTRIFPVLPKAIGGEVYISGITGADKTPLNAEYDGKVVIGSAGGEASYRLQLLIDGEPAIDTQVQQGSQLKEIQFGHVFKLRGPHEITAMITPESADRFGQNNVFNKVVNAIDRPDILLLASSNSSPLKLVLDEMYDVDARGSLPEDLSRYDAVVMDDIPAGRIGSIGGLRDFLNDGGGLVVVGGNSSYNAGNYYGSEIEGLLPVRSTETPPKTGEKSSVVIVIDISGSTGNTMGGDTKIDIEKALAVKMIRDLSKKADIGVVAFNADSFLIQNIKKVADTSALEDKISRLQFGGGTYVATGLARAGELLGSVQGSKYIVLISDGVTNYGSQAFDKASSLAASGVVIHTVGVGLDTDESFMQGLAIRGNGVYFKPTESERVKIVVGGLDEEAGQKGFSLIITDAHHFITEGLAGLNVSVKSFNEVTAKGSAQVLAASQGMKPLLAVWRFGLGRVASLMVDDGNIWAAGLYNEGNSKLVSSMVNWAVGDPERKMGVRVACVDARVGEATPVLVVSKTGFPKAFAGGGEMQLTRIDETSYYFDYYPLSVGYVDVTAGDYACAMAVNYPEEYGSFGADAALLGAIANMTGGRVYYPEDAGKLIDDVTEYTVEESTGVAVKRVNLELWFAAGALLLFLADIIIRRVREIVQNKPEGGRAKVKAVAVAHEHKPHRKI
jgi:uncharacterized membrane protein